MIVASGIAMQFGAKPLFSDVSVKFGGGYRYGLIDSNERVGRLRQDQFAFGTERVLDVVLQGHAALAMHFNVDTAIT